MYRLLKLALVSMLVVGSAHAVDAGKALFVVGDVKLNSTNGPTVALKKNALLEVGDTIITGSGGRAQLLLSDQTKIALQPDTQFKIEAFNYAASSTEDLVAALDNEARFGLLKGGFRSITGEGPKSNPESFTVKTPVAIIGIRGTDFLGRLCGQSDCGAGAQAGLYLGVNDGAIYAEVNGRRYDVNDDRFGFTDGSSFSHLSNLPTGILDSGLGSTPKPSGKALNRFISVAADPLVFATPTTHQTTSSSGGNVEEPAGHERQGTN